MINDLPSKMSTIVANYVTNTQGLKLFKQSMSNYNGNIEISEQNIDLVTELTLSRIKRRRPSLIVDCQNTSDPIERAKIYCKNKIPFVMITPNIFHDDLENIINKYNNVAVIDSPMSTPTIYFQDLIRYISNGNSYNVNDYHIKIINSHSPKNENIVQAIEDMTNKLRAEVKSIEQQIVIDPNKQLKIGIPKNTLKEHYFTRLFFFKEQGNDLGEFKVNQDSLILPFNQYLKQVALTHDTTLETIPARGIYQKGNKVVSNKRGIALTQRPVLGRNSSGKHIIGAEIISRVYGKNAYAYEILEAIQFLQRKVLLKEEHGIFSMKNVMTDI